MILDDIRKFRAEQLEREKAKISPEQMKKNARKISRPCADFEKALAGGGDKMPIIAEVKKASPSKGVISESFDPVSNAAQYAEAGAAAISCLTEEHYFQGSSRYLEQIRENTELPILRKDFIIDSYQIYEAKTIGADAILLIAAMLSDYELSEFGKIAASLDLHILAEAHDREELERVLNADLKIVGINNRDLRTFKVSLETTEELARFIPKDKITVSESGIESNADVRRLRSCGANAVLVGETLMRSGNIGKTLEELRDLS